MSAGVVPMRRLVDDHRRHLGEIDRPRAGWSYGELKGFDHVKEASHRLLRRRRVLVQVEWLEAILYNLPGAFMLGHSISPRSGAPARQGVERSSPSLSG